MRNIVFVLAMTMESNLNILNFVFMIIYKIISRVLAHAHYAAPHNLVRNLDWLTLCIWISNFMHIDIEEQIEKNKSCLLQKILQIKSFNKMHISYDEAITISRTAQDD